MTITAAHPRTAELRRALRELRELEQEASLEIARIVASGGRREELERAREERDRARAAIEDAMLALGFLAESSNGVPVRGGRGLLLCR